MSCLVAVDVASELRGCQGEVAAAQRARSVAAQRRAEAIRMARDAGWSWDRIAEVLGVSRPAVIVASRVGDAT